MANKSAILAVKIVSDAKDFKKGVDSASGDLDRFDSKVKGMAKGLAGAFAVDKILDFGKAILNSASEAEQAQGGVSAVFGQWTKDVDDFAENSAKRLGLANSQYDKLATGIGNSLKAAGVPMDQLAGKTDKLVGLGADMSSVFGGSTEEAVSAMGAAFRGEYDSLERFGILINDSKIMEGLRKKGLDKLTGSELAAAKQQEAYNQIVEQGTPFLGNFAKEADTAAGKQQRMAASFEDASAKLGQALLPAMGFFTEALTAVATWVSDNIGLVQTLAIAFGLLGVGILIATAPFTVIAVLVTALIGFIVYLATQTTFFQDVWAAMCKFAADAFGGFIGWITDGWNGFWGFITGAVDGMGRFFDDVLRNIGGFFSGTFNGARDLVLGVIGGITGAFDRVSGAVQGVIGWVRRLFSGFSIPGWMRDVMNFMGLGAVGYGGDDPSLHGLDPGMGAVGPGAMAGLFGSSGSSTVVTHQYSIRIDGALDANAVGRQLEDILKRIQRNSGSRSAAGGF